MAYGSDLPFALAYGLELLDAYGFPFDSGAAAYGFEADGAGEAGLSFLPPNSLDRFDSSPSVSTFFLPQPMIRLDRKGFCDILLFPNSSARAE